jgi:hypothetical protein
MRNCELELRKDNSMLQLIGVGIMVIALVTAIFVGVKNFKKENQNG